MRIGGWDWRIWILSLIFKVYVFKISGVIGLLEGLRLGSLRPSSEIATELISNRVFFCAKPETDETSEKVRFGIR